MTAALIHVEVSIPFVEKTAELSSNPSALSEAGFHFDTCGKNPPRTS
jgi:hypothetical protein